MIYPQAEPITSVIIHFILEAVANEEDICANNAASKRYFPAFIKCSGSFTYDLRARWNNLLTSAKWNRSKLITELVSVSGKTL